MLATALSVVTRGVPDITIDWARVARFYDAYASATFDLPFYLEEARHSPGEVLDLMAGTGRVTIPLLQAGVSVTCVDNSPAMLERLHQKLDRLGLSADVHDMSVCDLSLPRQFSLILLPSHSFSEILSVPDQTRALERIQAHLDDSGRFICTLHNPAARLKTVDGQLRLLGSYAFDEYGSRLVVWSIASRDSGSPLVHGFQFYEEYDARGTMREKSILPLHFSLIGRGEFEAMAESVGFKVVTLYGDYARAPFDEEASPYMIWVLGRR